MAGAGTGRCDATYPGKLSNVVWKVWKRDSVEEGQAPIARYRAKTSFQQAAAASHQLMATPLACFKCGASFSNMPALKGHLDEEFATERKQGSRERAR